MMKASGETGGNLMFSKDVLHTHNGTAAKTNTSSSSMTHKQLINKSLQYIFLLTTKKDAQGGGSMLAVDDNEGNPTLSHGIGFKTCIADRPHTMSTLISRDRNVYAGISQYTPGDYIVVAQSLKPLLHVYQWGKPQPLYHISTQEINTCVTSDASGNFLFTGTKKGYVYVWHVVTGELLTVWQAHFQTVNQLLVTQNQQFLISVSEDGMCKVWDLAQILDTNLFTAASLKMTASNQRTIIPFRSWSAHNLAVTGVYVLECFASLRVVTCSVDRSLHIYDVFANKSLVKYSLPQPLHYITCNPTLDYILCGSNAGIVYRIDFSVLAAGFSASKTHVVFANGKADATGHMGNGVHSIEAHTQAITSIMITPDNHRMITTSEDGMLKIWSLHTRQLLKEISPFSKSAITNCQLMLRPVCIDPTINKPSICPIMPLKKYMDQTNSNGKISFGPTLVGNTSEKAETSPTVILIGGISTHNMKGFGKAKQQLDEVANSNNEDDADGDEDDGNIMMMSGSNNDDNEDDEGDDLEFVPLGKDIVEFDESENSSDDEEEDEAEEENEELAEALEKIKQLEKDTAHWKQLCEEMQTFIQQQSTSATNEVIANSEENISEKKKKKRNRKKNKQDNDDQQISNEDEEEPEEQEAVVEEVVEVKQSLDNKKQDKKKKKRLNEEEIQQAYIEEEKVLNEVKAKKIKVIDHQDESFQSKLSKAEKKRQKLLLLKKKL